MYIGFIQERINLIKHCSLNTLGNNRKNSYRPVVIWVSCITTFKNGAYPCILPCTGEIPVANDRLIKYVTSSTIEVAPSLRSLAGRSSVPVAFL